LPINELFLGDGEDTWPILRLARNMLSCSSIQQIGTAIRGPEPKPQSRGKDEVDLRHPPQSAGKSAASLTDLETGHLNEWKSNI